MPCWSQTTRLPAGGPPPVPPWLEAGHLEHAVGSYDLQRESIAGPTCAGRAQQLSTTAGLPPCRVSRAWSESRWLASRKRRDVPRAVTSQISRPVTQRTRSRSWIETCQGRLVVVPYRCAAPAALFRRAYAWSTSPSAT